MRSYRFIQLDVFTNRPLAGNPLAVFPEAAGIEDIEMQKIAREMNLSETVFVLPSEHESVLRKLRIFTPGRELPFAGHPVVGTWNALAREGVVPSPEGGSGTVTIQHEIGIGILPVEIEFSDGLPVSVTMTQGEFRILFEVDDLGQRAEIARGLGLAIEDLDESLPMQTISTGLPFLVVPVRSLQALLRCRLNSSILNPAQFGEDVDACYVFTRETLESESSQAHARLFAPEFGIAEDPATGGAAGPLSAYLVYHDALNIKPEDGLYRFVIEQGDFVLRPSRIRAEVKGRPGEIELVRICGESVVVAEGNLFF